MRVGTRYGRVRCSEEAQADVKISTARSIDALAALATAALTFAYRYLSFERFANDHFVHLSRAQQVLLGALPVRDYSEYQAPLAVMASAWAQVTFGPGLRAELLLVCGAFAVAAAVAYLVTASVSGSRVVGIACALVLTAVTPVTYSYPKVLPYAVAFGAAWLYAQKPNAWRIWLLAATVVFGGLLRHDHAVLLGVGAIVAVLATHGPTREGATALGRLVLAGAVLSAPYTIWVQRYEGVGNYLASNIEVGRLEAHRSAWSPPEFALDRSRPLWVRMADPQEPIVYVRWQQDLPAEARRRAEAAHRLRLMGDIENDAGQYEIQDASPAAVSALVRDPAVRETGGIDTRNGRLQDRRPLSAHVLRYLVLPGEGLRPASIALLYYISWVLPLVVGVLLAIAWRRLTTEVRAISLMAMVVQVIMCWEMLREPLPTRVRDVVVPLVVLLALIPVLTRARGALITSARVMRSVALATLYIVVGAAAAGAGTFGQNLRETGISRGWRGVTARVTEIRERYQSPYERIGFKPTGLIEYVLACTPPQSRFLAMGNVQQVFFYTKRGFAGGYDALSGFYTSSRQVAQILQRLSHEDVPLVILDNEEADSLMHNYPAIAAYVGQRYHEATRFDAGQGKAYIVLVENARTPVRSFGGDSLPCFVPQESTHLSQVQ
jgi:hypothetical protein